MSAPTKMVEILCYGCGATGAVAQVTAGLQCRCGSHDLDLYTGSEEQKTALRRIWASRHQPTTGNVPYEFFIKNNGITLTTASQAPTFVQWMTKESLVSGDVPGWNEYSGPMPGPSTESNGVGTPMVCPVCHGTGFDLQDGGECRECGGKGLFTPNTDAETPAVARHDYPSNQTKVPFMGRKRQAGRATTNPMGSPEQVIKETTPGYGVGPNDQGMYPKGEHSPMVHVREQRDYSQPPTKPFELPEASCPNCGFEPTQLKKDYKEDAWWTCPNCGPLANIDRHPEIDPYNVSRDFVPNRNFRESKKFGGRKTGRLLQLMAKIEQSNPGLSPQGILSLGRRTVIYTETR